MEFLGERESGIDLSADEKFIDFDKYRRLGD